MRKVLGILVAMLLLLPSIGRADTAFLSNGERYAGKIQTPRLTVETPYGRIAFDRAWIQQVLRLDTDAGGFVLETINNDRFSGSLLPDRIDIATIPSGSRSLPTSRIKSLVFDYSRGTKEIHTAIFFARNGDKFSGKLLTDPIRVKDGTGTHRFIGTDINRIDFTDGNGMKVNVLLKSGTQVIGRLMDARLHVQPDAAPALAICSNRLSAIQFNSDKLVVRRFPANSATIADLDGDGVPNALDQCPDSPCGARVNKNGCLPVADADGDGVADRIDQCPHTPAGAKVDARGCWVIPETLFDFAKASIRPEYRSHLERVVRILKQNPGTKLEIQGYSDNIGTRQYNLKLTRARAEAVRRYLIENGIAADRLTAVGYGEVRPIASNDTKAGRARNRRVELVPKK